MRERRGAAPRGWVTFLSFYCRRANPGNVYVNRAQTNYTRNNRNFQGELGRKNRTLHVQLNSFFNFIL